VSSNLTASAIPSKLRHGTLLGQFGTNMSDTLQKIVGRSIRSLSNEAALNHIASLVDLSSDHLCLRGAEHALLLLDKLKNRDLSPSQAATLHYFRANAWSVKSKIAQQDAWFWERTEMQQEILELSRAVNHDGFNQLDKVRKCQILTNRANALNAAGRFIDAIEAWDHALRVIPRFAMAHGNRGHGLKYYAMALYDPGHCGIFLLHAHDAFQAAAGGLYDSEYPPETKQAFVSSAERIALTAPLNDIRANQNLDNFSLGKSKREQSYRRWCLEERLFLNPLNDLGIHPIAAQDVLTLPGITERIDARNNSYHMPPIIGFYNQMKQEFVSARYMLFEGLHKSGPHFSDRDVLLYNTLDYPSYSLATEQVRLSYRAIYSILDKIAFFINRYWELGIPLKAVNFSKVWYSGKNLKNLHPAFNAYENRPLRGLFWLSKEIFDEELKQCTNPDARELHEIRNHLEHKYLQVHQGWLPDSSADTADEFRKAISIDQLEAKALRITKIIRSALIYLSLAVHREEKLRRERNPKSLVVPMHMDTWDDKWKHSWR
jgi:hypothetical protein